MSLALGPDLLTASESLDDDTVELRRAIHQDPELGLQLPNTQQKILDAITGLGLDVTLGRETTSVTADLDSGKPGPTILLRGDMDALPLQEDNDIPFKSKHDGRMHACGHDAHVSMLVSAAKLLADNRDSFNGRIRFMFQPGEEGHHGAKFMIEEGVLDGVDRAFAIHVFTPMPDGVIMTKGGSLMASADRFEITINGQGGHASAPHHCVDPIPAAAATITGLHTLVSRGVDPVQAGLITVAHVEAGTTNNVIPPDAFMEGTIRTLDEDVRSDLHAGLIRVADHTAKAHGCSCTSEIIPGYPVTVNHQAEADLVGELARSVVGEEHFLEMPRAVLGAEDFSYVLQHVPGAMAFLGVCPPGVDYNHAAPNHSNLMQISEERLSHGVALYAAMALHRN
ncbi:MAG: M20 family metallopeptidase [Actinomycetota bacterium]